MPNPADAPHPQPRIAEDGVPLCQAKCSYYRAHPIDKARAYCRLTDDGHCLKNECCRPAVAAIVADNERLRDRINALIGKLSNEQPRKVEELAEEIARGANPKKVLAVAVSEYKAHFNLRCELHEEDLRKLSQTEAENARLRAELAAVYRDPHFLSGRIVKP